MFERVPEPEFMQGVEQCQEYNQEFIDYPQCLASFIDTYNKFVGIHAGTIIDLGSGTCNFVIELCKVYPKLNFVCYEVSEEMIKIANQNIINNQLDNRIKIVEDNFFNACGTFDVVIANRVLHHINDTDNFWKLLSRLSNQVLVCDLERPYELDYIQQSITGDLKNSFMAAYTVDEVSKQISNYNYYISREIRNDNLCTYTVFTNKDT
jgi:2-polyprenyl-3-methyl-5-hydroxy-6-metoxy-1,4-benzoquinol methylase